MQWKDINKQLLSSIASQPHHYNWNSCAEQFQVSRKPVLHSVHWSTFSQISLTAEISLRNNRWTIQLTCCISIMIRHCYIDKYIRRVTMRATQQQFCTWHKRPCSSTVELSQLINAYIAQHNNYITDIYRKEKQQKHLLYSTSYISKRNVHKRKF